MNKAELIERVSKDTNLTKSEIEKSLNAITDLIKKTLKKGEEV